VVPQCGVRCGASLGKHDAAWYDGCSEKGSNFCEQMARMNGGVRGKVLVSPSRLQSRLRKHRATGHGSC